MVEGKEFKAKVLLSDEVASELYEDIAELEDEINAALRHYPDTKHVKIRIELK